MQNYTPDIPAYSGSIKIVEVTDPVSADNANAAVKQLIANDAVLKASIDAVMENGVKIADVSGATARTTEGVKAVALTWSDPEDVEVDGAVIAAWKGTMIVRKEGSAPTDKNDGDMILNNMSRNVYASTPYTDTDVEYEKTYYYGFFTYTSLPTITKGSAVSAIPSKETLSTPTPSDTLTYNGSSQTMSFNNYDPSKMSVSGNSATDAGDHTATFTLNSDYKWSDNTTAPKEVGWSIKQAAGSATIKHNGVTFNPSTGVIELNTDVTQDTITVTNATGNISSAVSSDTSVIKATVSGSTIKITSVDETTGSATVTIKIASSKNYKAVDIVINVTATFSGIWGASWDGTSTTAWSRTDDAAGFTDPVPYVAGSTSYGSPFDEIMPWAGMTKEERTGGTMVKIPKFWYKITQNGAGMKIQISDGEQDGFKVSPAHMDRGDGKGERDAIYVGRYHCGASAFKSATGQNPKSNTTRANFRTSIHNLGSDIWQLDFATRFTIWLLYIVEFANWNSQAQIGYGCGNNSGVQSMGYTDSMPYHTGTTQSSRTTYGLGTQYRYIEGLWDNVYDWVDGCYYNSSGLNIILNPSSFSDSSGGTSVGTPSSGYPSAFSVKSISNTFDLFIPTTANGSDSTYSCDYWYFYASYPCLCAGGGYDRGLSLGLFCIDCNGASYQDAYFGSRLMELP